MRKIIQELTVHTDKSKIVLHLGDVYKVYKPYYSNNWQQADLDDTCILALLTTSFYAGIATFMVVSITPGTHTIVDTMTDDNIHGIIDHSKGRYDFDINNTQLLKIITSFTSNNSNEVYIESCGRYIKVSTYIMTCSKDNLSKMRMVPIGRIMDMRVWPRIAINMWIENQLQLPMDQQAIVHNINERWKAIESAQEMFTHQCADFNKSAKKIVAAYKKKMAAENPYNNTPMASPFIGTLPQDIRGGEIDYLRNHEDYLIVLNSGFLSPVNRYNGKTLTMFHEPATGNRYNLLLERNIKQVGMYEVANVACSINNVYHYTELNFDRALYSNDICIIQSEGICIHIKEMCYAKEEYKPIRLPDVAFRKGDPIGRVQNAKPNVSFYDYTTHRVRDIRKASAADEVIPEREEIHTWNYITDAPMSVEYKPVDPADNNINVGLYGDVRIHDNERIEIAHNEAPRVLNNGYAALEVRAAAELVKHADVNDDYNPNNDDDYYEYEAAYDDGDDDVEDDDV